MDEIRSAHGDELFGARRMNGNGIVEILFGGTHPNGYREPCIISSAPVPMTWQPTIFCLGPTHTNFTSVCDLRVVSA
jgi:hypothetical protein